MRGGDDDRLAARDVIEHRPHDSFAFIVAQDELLREIGQDTDAVRTRIDHEIHGAVLPLEVEPPVLVEHCWCDRKNTLVAACRICCRHGRFLSLSIMMLSDQWGRWYE